MSKCSENTNKNTREEYTPPIWAGIPSQPLFIDSIREGVVFEQHCLENFDHFFIGSLPSSVDIIYKNPLVSRRHAVIQFNQEGDAFVMDLSSTHGTWLGDIKIPSLQYIPLKLGARLLFGSKHSKRAFVTRGAQEMKYPEGVSGRYNNTLEDASKSSTLDSTENPLMTNEEIHHFPMFDKDGKIMTTFQNVLLSKGKQHEIEHKRNLISDTYDSHHLSWNSESIDTSENTCEKVKEMLKHHYDPTTGLLSVSNIRKSKMFASLSNIQVDLLRQIEHAQKKKRVNGASDEDAQDMSFLSQDFHNANGNSGLEVQVLIQRLLEPSETNSQEGENELTDEELHVGLSELTKQALDERLFDEQDSFFDRTEPVSECSNESQKTKINLQKLEKELCDIQSIVAAEEAEIENRVQNLPAPSEDEDELDKFMRENEAAIEHNKLDSLRQQESTIAHQIETLQKQLEETDKQNIQESNSAADTTMKKVNAGSSVGSNKAVLAASHAVAQIARNHENSKKQRNH